MDQYTIIRTDVADALLHKIILGIAENFDGDTAINVLNEIEDNIMLLENNPNMGMKPRYMVLRRQGYQVLILKKALVFYKVNEFKKLLRSML